MYRFGTIAGLMVLAVLTATPSLHGQTARPNVVFIMTDAVGYGDIGSYGGPDIDTPNIDQLATDGAMFTDFYGNVPVCTPTRAGFVAGRYQQRVGLERPLSGPGRVNGLGAGGEWADASAATQGQRLHDGSDREVAPRLRV